MFSELLSNSIYILTHAKILSGPRKLARQFLSFALSTKNGVIVYYNTPERNQAMKLIKKIKREKEMVLFDNEAYQLYITAKASAKVPGDMAEVGVYKGASAKLISQVKGKKDLYLFDTFAGIPQISKNDNPAQFYEGKFTVSFEETKKYLKNLRKVHIFKGLFPKTSGPIKNKRFSFVNIDVELYESTKNCLKFFYPRMNKGGFMLCHDYIDVDGVKKAVDEFFKNKKETVLELSGSHCLIVKL